MIVFSLHCSNRMSKSLLIKLMKASHKSYNKASFHKQINHSSALHRIKLKNESTYETSSSCKVVV